MKISDAIHEATLHFCNTMGVKLESGVKLGNDVYGASIPVFKEKGEKCEYHFYLYYKKDLLKTVAKTLFEIDFTDQDFVDMSRELANQIVGYAKNLLNDAEPGSYKLGTPEFLGHVEKFPIKFDEAWVYKIKNRTFKIGYQKI